MNLPGYDQPEIRAIDREALFSSLTRGASNRLTICEQLRFIYDIVEQLPDGEAKDDLTEKLIVALDMGKKMNSRLAHYKRKYLDSSGRTGSSLIRLDYNLERQIVREKR